MGFTSLGPLYCKSLLSYCIEKINWCLHFIYLVFSLSLSPYVCSLFANMYALTYILHVLTTYHESRTHMMHRVFGFGLNRDPLPHLSLHMVVMFILTRAISIIKKDFYYFYFYLGTFKPFFFWLRKRYF